MPSNNKKDVISHIRDSLYENSKFIFLLIFLSLLTNSSESDIIKNYLNKGERSDTHKTHVSRLLWSAMCLRKTEKT